MAIEDPFAIASCAIFGMLFVCMVAIQCSLSSLRRKTSQQYESLAERVDAAEERLEEVEDQVNDDTSLTKSIFNKIDDLSDFVRNKIVLKKDKVKPF